jgi:hypothetical protein
MFKKIEQLSGYLVDFENVRNWSQEMVYEKASSYSKKSLLQGKSIESGFVLVNDLSQIQLTDHYATPLILDILLSTDSEFGIQLRIERELIDDQMKSVIVTEI